jgi:RNA polymerase sigma-70 factor (ECF subfamily)
LHDVEGFTHREIAGLIGKTESFSKSQLSRAYQRLRPLLDAELENTAAARSLPANAAKSW